MPRKNVLAEVNSFIGGLVTEANPLAFPENASLDEENFELNNNGVRKRRLGFTHEPNHSTVNTRQFSIPSNGKVAVSTFLWKSPGGYSDKQFLVVRIGKSLQIFDTAVSPLSSGIIYTYPYLICDSPTDQVGITSIDNMLVFVDGYNVPVALIYDGTTFDVETFNIKIRDVFGVQATYLGSGDLEGSDKAEIRPATSAVTAAYYYNLRNQGWGIPRPLNASWIADDDVYDPITAFLIQTGGGSISASSRLPSISDSVVPQLYPDANATTNKFIDRFVVMQSVKNPVGNTEAPKGHFIISAVGSRGSSRISEFYNQESQYPTLTHISGLSGAIQDDAEKEPNVIASFAGRVFYAGFSRTAGYNYYDTRSPRLSSYVLFSKLVESRKDLGKCYQEGDPTSKEAPDLIDTDGGFISIKEMDKVVSMVNIGKALVVIATNGVWSIAGGNNYSFSATNFLVTKITEHGCTSPGSVVLVDGSVMYWGDDGIYHVSFDQYGDLKATNISNTKINKYYNTISTVDKTTASAMYDTYERRVRWLYQSNISGTYYTYELILDMNIGAFTRHRIGNYYLHRVSAIAEVPAYKLPSKDAYQRNVYIIDTNIAQTGLVLKPYSFGYYHDDTFYDWGNVDTPAYIQTGYNNSGTNLLNKQVPILNVFFERTEDGFTASGGDFIPKHQSSCLVRTMWDWSDSVNSGRWSPQFQAYRYKRQYYASSVSDTYDYGQNVIETRNKLRGKGKVLSINFSTEPGKDCRIMGWSTMVSADGRA